MTSHEPLRIAIPSDVLAELERIALEERRRPSDQAAVLLTEVLRRRARRRREAIK